MNELKKKLLRMTILFLFFLMFSCKQAETPEESVPTTDEMAPVEFPEETQENASEDSDKIKYCCANHNPNHCSDQMEDLRKLSRENNCIFE